MSNKQKYLDIFIESISINDKKFHENIEYNEEATLSMIFNKTYISPIDEGSPIRSISSNL